MVQTILVTGSTSGFGRLTVETLARQGYTVFAGMRAVAGKNAPAAEELRALAQREQLALQIVEIDVTDDASVEQAIAVIIETTGRLDVVVNNAGVSYTGPLEAFALEQVRQQFETNVFSVLRVNRAVLPQMRKQGSGLLLQIGSIAGRLALPFRDCTERQSLPWRDSPSRIAMNSLPLASTPPLLSLEPTRPPLLRNIRSRQIPSVLPCIRLLRMRLRRRFSRRTAPPRLPIPRRWPTRWHASSPNQRGSGHCTRLWRRLHNARLPRR